MFLCSPLFTVSDVGETKNLPSIQGEAADVHVLRVVQFPLGQIVAERVVAAVREFGGFVGVVLLAGDHADIGLLVVQEMVDDAGDGIDEIGHDAGESGAQGIAVDEHGVFVERAQGAHLFGTELAYCDDAVGAFDVGVG